jgi:DNA-binding beta-propeller fold protein YncE
MKIKHKHIVIAVGVVLLVALLPTIFLFFLSKISVTYIWVMDTGKLLNETYLVKMCPNGRIITQVQFGQSGAIGIDPRHNSVWAPELNDRKHANFDQIVKVDFSGNITNRFQGYRTSIIVVDPNNGNVWAGLPNEGQVVKLDSSGNPLLKIDGFPAPASIAVDPNDSSVWIADFASSSLVHLTADGVELFRTKTAGFSSNAPHQVAIDPRNGDVWYTHDSSVHKRSYSGQLLTNVSGFDRPSSISINPNDGSIWIADFSVDSSGGVFKLNASGEKILKVILDSPPHVVGVNPIDETIWVGINGAMIKLSDDGEILNTITKFTNPLSIAFSEIGGGIATKIKFAQTCYSNH